MKERSLILVDGLVADFGGYLIEIYEDTLMANEEARFVVAVRGHGDTDVHVMLGQEGVRGQAEEMIRMVNDGDYNGRKLMYDIECILGIQENGKHEDKFGKYIPEAT